MPRTLFLLRHAKSSRDDPAIADIDRPLNARGRAAAALLGQHLARKALLPQRVLCSPALRTRETWAILAAELPSPPETILRPELYDFGDGGPLLACLRQHGGEAQSVMLVSHNPSCHMLAQRLVGDGQGALLHDLAEKFPTGALCILAFPAAETWSDIRDGEGRLVDFIRPRDLADRP